MYYIIKLQQLFILTKSIHDACLKYITKILILTGKHRRSDPRSDSEFFTSTGKDSVFSRGGSGKNSKKTNGHTNGHAPHIYHEIDGMVGDLSVIDCSVIDTEYVSEYCQNQMQVSNETRRYSTGSEDNVSVEDGVENKNRLSVLSDDSAIKNNSDFASSVADAGDLSYSEMSDDEFDHVIKVDHESEETEPLVPRSESEINLLNKLNDVKLNMDSVSEVNLYRHYMSSGEELNHSTPCIKFKPGVTVPPKSYEDDTSGDSLQSSLPQLKITENGDLGIDQPFSHSMDLHPNSFRKKMNRLSRDSQTNSDALSYSEC